LQGGASTNQFVAFITKNLENQLSTPCCEFDASTRIFLEVASDFSFPFSFPVWLMSTSSTDPLSVKMAYFYLQLELTDHSPPSPVQVLDMNFFNDDELVLVLSVGEEEGSSRWPSFFSS